ncbi:helix-turn-helix domain-containing protein [Mangrovimonas sp. ST2L15]|uniref:helix-turn-helix domain-containing protein n=1 Tax=Mangrovimonas sp. ST2L15 TaxID=1645916 RepID=UPI0006B649E3|nr:helix-turn-helix transcriptional regulator [Mangrovimonas sp. ST2L15]
MVNSSEFAIRLQKIMEYYQESASSFAEKIGVQRSSISHILSGRNKPSLDFVLKILSSYPEVELYWLLNGKGQFPDEGQEKNTLFSNEDLDVKENKKSPEKTSNEVVSEEFKKDGNKIERIVIFYKDGTFRNFEPS